jgi:hypothetical protein
MGRPCRRSLGLSEYARAFAENGIDVSVLPHLTDQDVKDVGVLLGHRRKILAAVAELPASRPSESKPLPPLMEPTDHQTTEPPQPAVVDAKNGVMCRVSHFPSALDGGSVW